MPHTADKGHAARHLLLSCAHGVLSTHSVDVPGYPFGSITPYVLDHAGNPMIFISTLAQHTRNILADARVSLTLHDATAEDVQAGARLTWLADAEPVGADDAAAFARYVRYVPQAVEYQGTHDFQLYRLVPKRARFIGGFGRIFWVEADEVRRANPFAESEEGIVAHMNEDHAHNLSAYCRAFKGLTPEAVTMLGLDAEGFDVHADGRLVRFAFEAPIATPQEAREALVAMARAAARTLAD